MKKKLRPGPFPKHYSDDYVSLRYLDFGRIRGILVQDNYIVDTFIVESLEDARRLIRQEYGPITVSGVTTDLKTVYGGGGRYAHLGLTPFGSASVRIEAVINEIERETQWLRGMGWLMPFIEGMPLGVIPANHRADRRGENGRGGQLPRGWRSA